MKKRLLLWETAGFLFTAAVGALLHFSYDWSGGTVLAAAFSAVNESTWEHMKLLFLRPGRGHAGGPGSHPHALLYLHRRVRPPLALGGYRRIFDRGGRCVCRGLSFAGAPAARRIMAAGGGAAGFVASGIFVHLFYVPAAPAPAVAGPGHGALRHPHPLTCALSRHGRGLLHSQSFHSLPP